MTVVADLRAQAREAEAAGEWVRLTPSVAVAVADALDALEAAERVARAAKKYTEGEGRFRPGRHLAELRGATDAWVDPLAGVRERTNG